MTARKIRLQLKLKKAIQRFHQSHLSDQKRKRIKQLRRYHRQCVRYNCLPTLSLREGLLLALLLGSGIAAAQQPEPLANQEIVNTDGSHITPSIGMNSNGDYVVAWSASGLVGEESFGIYAQRHAGDGSKIGNAFRVNSYSQSYQIFTSVALDDDGDFVIAWASNGQDGSGYGIYMQRYDNQGQKVGAETRVNTITEGTQEEPDIAMNAEGDFVIVWEGASSTFSNGISTYFRRYDKNGVALDAVEKIWWENLTLDTYNPSVAMGDDGGFVIATQYGRSNNTNKFDILYATYDPDGTRTFDSYVHYRITEDQQEPDVAMDSDGDFVIAYESIHNGVQDILLFASSGAFWNQQVSSFTQTNNHLPAVAIDSDGDFVISWTYYGNTASEVYSRAFSHNGQSQGLQFQVDQASNGFPGLADIAMQANGDFVTIWRHDGINQRRFAVSEVELLCSDLGIGNDYEFEPRVGMDADGDHVISWIEGFDQGKLKFQRYDQDGRATGLPTEVATAANAIFDSNLAMDAAGNFVLVWHDQGIKLRSYLANGNPATPEKSIGTGAAPDVALASQGDYVVVFTDQSESPPRIMMQRYDANHNALGGLSQVNGSGGLYLSNPAVAKDASGDYAVVWEADDEVYLRRFNQNGNALTGNIWVNGDYTTGIQRNPDVAMDEQGNMVVVWRGPGPSSAVTDLVYQRTFDPNGMALSNSTVVEFESLDQSTPKIAIAQNGTKVITFERDDEIALVAYQPDGSILFKDLAVASEITGSRSQPQVAMDADGDFITAHLRFNEFSFYNTSFKRLYAIQPSNCLKQSLYLDDQLSSDDYRAVTTIEALGQVESPSQVSFKAGQNISLLAGFEVEQGATFLAEIEGCQ